MVLLLFFIVPLNAEPWGKDADLAYSCQTAPCCASGPGVFTSDLVIDFHQNIISEADGPRSHYVPRSSQYMREAIHKYGFLYGYLLGCDRLMRENDEVWVYPLVQGPLNLLKYDPVR